MSKKLKKDQKPKIDRATICIWTIILLFIAFATWAFTSAYISENEKQQELEKLRTKNIKSCIDSEDGTFILGLGGLHTGSMTTIDYYFYLQKNEGYTLVDVGASYVEIVETDEQDAYITGHFDKYGNILEWVDVLLEFDEDYTERMTRYTLYLPKGYKTQEFNTVRVLEDNK